MLKYYTKKYSDTFKILRSLYLIPNSKIRKSINIFIITTIG